MSCAVRSTRRRPTSGSSCSTASGSRLLVGGFGVLRLLDGRSFRELAELEVPAPDLQFINVAFSPDGRALVAMYGIGDGRTTMLRYDGRTGRRLGHPVAMADPLGLTDFAAFTPDGRGLLTAARDPGALAPSPDPSPDLGGREIVVRDPRTLRPLRRFPGFALSGALSPDGRTFAAGDADGSVHFLDLRTGRQRTALGRHTASVDRAQFTADGRFLVTVGRRRGGDRLGRQDRRGGRHLRRPCRPRGGAGRGPQRTDPLHRGRRRDRDHVGPRRPAAPRPPLRRSGAARTASPRPPSAATAARS